MTDPVQAAYADAAAIVARIGERDGGYAQIPLWEAERAILARAAEVAAAPAMGGVSAQELLSRVRRYGHPDDSSYDAGRFRAYEQMDEALQELTEDAALAPAASSPAPWSPPPEADRPQSYRCLVCTDSSADEWEIARWVGGFWWGLDVEGQATIIDPTAFAPLPPAPAQKG